MLESTAISSVKVPVSEFFEVMMDRSSNNDNNCDKGKLGRIERLVGRSQQRVIGQ